MRGLLGTCLVHSASVKPYQDKLRYHWMAQAFERAGKGGAFGESIRIHGNLRIELEERVAFRDGCQLGGNGLLRVGDRTSIKVECMLVALERIEIGSDVMLAPRVYVLDVDHCFSNRSTPISKQGYLVSPVTLGEGVWIGTGAVEIKGVTIGEGAIIGANSLVTRDIPPYTVAAGIPARVIKERPE